MRSSDSIRVDTDADGAVALSVNTTGALTTEPSGLEARNRRGAYRCMVSSGKDFYGIIGPSPGWWPVSWQQADEDPYGLWASDRPNYVRTPLLGLWSVVAQYSGLVGFNTIPDMQVGVLQHAADLFTYTPIAVTSHAFTASSATGHDAKERGDGSIGGVFVVTDPASVVSFSVASLTTSNYALGRPVPGLWPRMTVHFLG